MNSGFIPVSVFVRTTQMLFEYHELTSNLLKIKNLLYDIHVLILNICVVIWHNNFVNFVLLASSLIEIQCHLSCKVKSIVTKGLIHGQVLWIHLQVCQPTW